MLGWDWYWVPSLRVSPVKVRSLIGNEQDPENCNEGVCADKAADIEPLNFAGSFLPIEAALSLLSEKVNVVLPEVFVMVSPEVVVPEDR